MSAGLARGGRSRADAAWLRLAAWLERIAPVAYVLLALVPAGLLLARWQMGSLEADVWEHAANIRELARNPVDPGHPLFELDLPSPLMSPYAVALAIASRTLGIGAMDILVLAGLVNLPILLLALWKFVRIFTDLALAPVIALALTLAAWGGRSWQWSGFFHLDSLPYVLPYPSTLAVAAALLSLWLVDRWRTDRGAWRLLVVAAAAWFVVLVHPYTGALLGAGLVALGLRDRPGAARASGAGVAAAGVGGLVALAWPYYPVLGLLATGAVPYHEAQEPVYQELGRMAPALFGLPALAIRAGRDRRDPLVVMFVLLLVPYVGGALTGQFTLGRVLPQLILVLHLALAILFAEWWHAVRPGPRSVRQAALVAGLLAAGFLLSWQGVRFFRSQLFSLEGDPALDALIARTAPAEVVMTDRETSLRVPATGGRVVGWGGAIALVPDLAERNADVERFFAPGTAPAERARLLRCYGVDWILVNRDEVAAPSDGELTGLGEEVAAADGRRLVLLRLPPAEPSAADCSPPA